MRRKKESRPSGYDTRAAAETAAFGRAAISYGDCTTPAAGRQSGFIASLLSCGAENAIPRRHLRQLTGLSDRDLRRRIQRERMSGIPILADNLSGYYLPADKTELDRFVSSMRGRAREIQAVAAAIEQAEG